MFAGLVKQAKSAASDLALKYLARASVALPFVIALGFALAAVTVTLVERYGQVMAYWMVAGSLAIIGVVAAAVVSVKEQEEEQAEQAAMPFRHLNHSAATLCLRACTANASGPFSSTFAFIQARKLSRSRAILSHVR